MAGVVQGKLIGVKVNGKYIRCQTDATLVIAVKTQVEPACKPDETQTTDGSSWDASTVDTKSWKITVKAKTFLDTVTNTVTNTDIMNIMLVGSSTIDVTFQTIKTTDYGIPRLMLFEGTGILTSFTVNAPIAGESTYDLSIDGTGTPTYTETVVTS